MSPHKPTNLEKYEYKDDMSYTSLRSSLVFNLFLWRQQFARVWQRRHQCLFCFLTSSSLYVLHTRGYSLHTELRRMSIEQGLGRTKSQSTYIFRVPQCVFPRRNWDSPTPCLASELFPSPRTKGGGGTLARGQGIGGVPIPTTEEKLSTLPTLGTKSSKLRRLTSIGPPY